MCFTGSYVTRKARLAADFSYPVSAEHASQLMQKAFDVAIATNIGTASYISDAMALLNVQTGA